MVLVFFCYVVYIFGSCTTLHVKSECESAFLSYLCGMQIACAILYRHLWPVWLYHISPNYIKKARFSKERKNLLNTKCVFWFSLQILSKKFLIQRRIPQDIIMNVQRSSCAVPDSDFHKTWIFSTYFRETPRYQISWKSVCCESRCSMRTDGRTDGHTWNS